MPPKAIVPFAIALASLGVACSTASAAETLKLDLASVTNLDATMPTVQSAPLAAGVDYVVTVSGTGSIWSTDQQSPITCGLPETQLIADPTPGQPAFVANLDAALLFAAPQGIWLGSAKACYGAPGEPVIVPPLHSGFRFGPAGSMAYHAPTGGVPAAPAGSHVYSYDVKGTGAPLGFQYLDRRVDDNSGIFTIVVRPANEAAPTTPVPTTPVATTPAATTPVATTPQPEGPQPTITTFGDQTALPSSGAGSTGSQAPATPKPPVKASACVSASVLAVHLVPTKSALFTKAVYSLNGKKVATVTGAKLYTSKTKKSLAIVKFRKLPAGAITLKVVVTLKGGKTITEKRTYARCTPPSKSAQQITVKK